MPKSNHRRRLRQDGPLGRDLELAVEETILPMLIADSPLIMQFSAIEVNDELVPLRQQGNGPWMHEMANRMVQAALTGELPAAENLADKILTHSSDPACEAIRMAAFVKGHLLMCRRRYYPANEFLELAASVPCSFSAAAHHNLAIAWVHLQNPESAWNEFKAAIDDDPNIIASRISKFRLAKILECERAPNLAGEPSWSKAREQEEIQLSQMKECQVRAQLFEESRFPTYRFLHTLQMGPYFPAISALMQRTKEGQPAALHLLAEAKRALSQLRYQQAHLLAKAVPTFSDFVRPDAESVARQAASKMEEQRQMELARLIIDRLGKFFMHLDSLSLPNLHAAEEMVVLLAPLLKDSDLRELYDDRIEKVVLEAIPGTDTDRRSRLLAILKQYAASAESGEAYGRAMACCLAELSRQIFWKSIDGNDLTGAEAAFGSIVQFLGSDITLENEKAILTQLKDIQNLRAASPAPKTT